MISLLLQLIPGLSDTVEVWDQFVEKEIEYFSCQGDPPNALVSPIEAIDKVFREMKLLHKRLEKLRKEIREENLQGVSSLFHPEFQIEMHPSIRYLRDTVTNQHSSMLI
jgi:hypothetical protein